MTNKKLSIIHYLITHYQLSALLNQGMKIKIEQSQIFLIQELSNY
ncbi:hypothetical protein [Dapis sp. BLCC M172]